MRVRVVVALVVSWGALAACGYTIQTRFPDPEPVEAQSGPLVALLGGTDLRLRRGGGATHKDVRTPLEPVLPPADPYAARRYPYAYPDPFSPFGVPQAPQTDTQRVATGELGTDEALPPLLDALAARLKAHLGDDAVRDASADPLAADPDAARAAAFLAHYRDYDAATWVELIDAHARLPDTSLLASTLNGLACCTLGVGALLFLVPVPLDTTVRFRARAYLVRSGSAPPLSAAATREQKLKARGSPGFDLDAFRADVADRLGRDVGRELADKLVDGLEDPSAQQAPPATR
ncbi:MAG: hypothetical protein HY904_11785 [Deltaproteobacteria bacterium]|nr:hypothetical protein [Deltaproteobacteria bacterium]